MQIKDLEKHFCWLKVRKLPVCDGTTENYDMGFLILYPIFAFTGMAIFMYLLVRWEAVRDFIKRRF